MFNDTSPSPGQSFLKKREKSFWNIPVCKEGTTERRGSYRVSQNFFTSGVRNRENNMLTVPIFKSKKFFLTSPLVDVHAKLE